MDKTAKILITGSTGMIGSAIARLLKKQGYSNILTPSHQILELRSQALVVDHFKQHKPEYVFHCAAMVGGIHANSTYPATFIYDNTQMHCNVIESAYQNGAKKLLLPGSACTYPKLAPQPIPETEFLNGFIEPTNLAYSAAKINVIVMAQSYHKQYGFKTIVPMPTNAYGINDNFDPNASHVIPGLMKRFHEAKLQNLPEVVIWGSGTPMREFIYVDDLANALIFLMQQYDSSELINIGSRQEISIADLAQKVALTVGYQGKIALDTSKPDGAPRKCLDSAKLFALGWKPTVNLSEGLQRMYEHHFINTTSTAGIDA